MIQATLLHFVRISTGFFLEEFSKIRRCQRKCSLTACVVQIPLIYSLNSLFPCLQVKIEAFISLFGTRACIDRIRPQFRAYYAQFDRIRPPLFSRIGALRCALVSFLTSHSHF